MLKANESKITDRNIMKDKRGACDSCEKLGYIHILTIRIILHNRNTLKKANVALLKAVYLPYSLHPFVVKKQNIHNHA